MLGAIVMRLQFSSSARTSRNGRGHAFESPCRVISRVSHSITHSLSQHSKQKRSHDHHSRPRRHHRSRTTLIRHRRSTSHSPISSTTRTPIPTPTRTPTSTPLLSQPPHQLREQNRRIPILHNPTTNRTTPIKQCPNLLLRTSRPGIKRVAKLQRLLDLLAPELQRIARPLRAIITPFACVFEAGGDVAIEQCSCEDLVCGLGLVGGDFVAGLVDAGEGEVAVLAHLAAGVCGVGEDGGVAG
jgi:hypothetical protein